MQLKHVTQIVRSWNSRGKFLLAEIPINITVIGHDKVFLETDLEETSSNSNLEDYPRVGDWSNNPFNNHTTN